ncbi:MAG TPA: hypothetical protein VFG94_15300 [Acidimicrobiales bacterium]|nr:hypothetical protein [Acidimicrobiales bacterium]
MPASSPSPTHRPVTASSRADAIVRCFRRIGWQRIDLRPDGTGQGVLSGTRHRLPTTMAVPLAVAWELRRRGVRTVLHREP